ncbi:MAG: glycosyltransferase family 39 protein [Candidatus Erginobacter occultus]|nr:glycosyltransferase family 39 protein [Candidatus Erginobacter occultus]
MAVPRSGNNGSVSPTPASRFPAPEVLYPLTVVLLFIFFTSLYSLATPLWEAPDEPAHYLRVRRLAEPGFSPPDYPEPLRTVWSERYLYSFYQNAQPPLYYLAAAVVLKGIHRIAEPPPPEVLFPPVRTYFGLEKGLFLRPPVGLRDRLSEAYSVYGLRVFSWLLGALTVFLIYRIGRVVAPGEPAVALGAGGFAACLPQFNFISGAIGNDPAAALLGTGTLLYLVGRAGKERAVRSRYYLGLGCLLALGLLTKFNLVFLLPTALVFIFLKAREPGMKIGGWAALALTAAPLVLLGLTAVFLIPGEVSHQARILSFRLFRFTPELLTWVRTRYMISTVYRSFFALFGWMSLPVSGWLYLAWGLLAAAALAGWINRANGESFRLEESLHRPAGLLATAAVILLLGVVKNNLLAPQSQGRFLFPALGAIAVLFSAGYCRLFPARYRLPAVWALLAALASLNLVAFCQLLVRIQ